MRKIAEELRKWWSFDDRGHHTHSLLAREAFISKVLPDLLADYAAGGQGWLCDRGCREVPDMKRRRRSGKKRNRQRLARQLV